MRNITVIRGLTKSHTHIKQKEELLYGSTIDILDGDFVEQAPNAAEYTNHARHGDKGRLAVRKAR
jgi:hypothetical protein